MELQTNKTRSAQTWRLATGRAGYLAKARALQSIEGKSAPGKINIQNIASQEELLRFLNNSWTIIAYRGYGSTNLPSLEQEDCHPFGGSIENQRTALDTNVYEREIERIRRESFPTCPSRLASIFLAPSPAEAGKWGQVFVVELSLRQDYPPKTELPIRWLNRRHFEDLTRSSWGWKTELAPSEFQYIYNYLGSIGFPDEPADILVDPEQVQIIVKKPYRPTTKEVVKNIVENLLKDDPLGWSAPANLEELDDRLNDRALEPKIKQLVRQEAIRQMLEKLYIISHEDISPREPTFYADYTDLIQARELLNALEHPPKRLVAKIRLYDNYGIALYLKALQAKTAEIIASGWHPHSLNTFAQLLTWYQEACRLAEKDIDRKEINRLKNMIGKEMKPFLFENLQFWRDNPQNFSCYSIDSIKEYFLFYCRELLTPEEKQSLIEFLIGQNQSQPYLKINLADFGLD